MTVEWAAYPFPQEKGTLRMAHLDEKAIGRRGICVVREDYLKREAPLRNGWRVDSRYSE